MNLDIPNNEESPEMISERGGNRYHHGTGFGLHTREASLAESTRRTTCSVLIAWDILSLITSCVVTWATLGTDV